jgi:hypothetical protein
MTTIISRNENWHNAQGPVNTNKLSTFSYCFDSRAWPKNCRQSAKAPKRQSANWHRLE